LPVKRQQILQTKLTALQKDMPDATHLCVISSSGSIMAQIGQVDEALTHRLTSLRVAAGRLANSLQVESCPVFQVKGETYIYCCYAMENSNLLSFFIAPPKGPALFDTMRFSVDIEPHLEDIDFFLKAN